MSATYSFSTTSKNFSIQSLTVSISTISIENSITFISRVVSIALASPRAQVFILYLNSIKKFNLLFMKLDYFGTF